MNEACNKHREAPIVGRFECGSCALEKVRSERYELAAENDRLRAELAALKAGQGEAVAWIVTDINGDSYFAYDRQTPSDTPLYTAPPATADAVSVPADRLAHVESLLACPQLHTRNEYIKAAEELRAILARQEVKS